MAEILSTEKYTRVSTILQPFSGLDQINPEIVQNAANRGTAVHRVCEGIVSGLGEHGVYDEIKGYVESFKKWWEIGHEVLMVEKRFFDDDLMITGQCDLIIREGSDLIIIDLKTSYRPSKTWPVQGAAYAYLARKNKHDIRKIQFLHLKKTGKEPTVYEYPLDDGLFLSTYEVYKHFYQTSSERAHEKISRCA